MKVIFTAAQKKHDPTMFFSSGTPQSNPEQPERADRLLAAAQKAGLEHVEPRDFGLEFIARVHRNATLRISKTSLSAGPAFRADRRK